MTTGASDTDGCLLDTTIYAHIQSQYDVDLTSEPVIANDTTIEKPIILPTHDSVRPSTAISPSITGAPVRPRREISPHAPNNPRSSVLRTSSDTPYYGCFYERRKFRSRKRPIGRIGRCPLTEKKPPVAKRTKLSPNLRRVILRKRPPNPP